MLRKLIASVTLTAGLLGMTTAYAEQAPVVAIIAHPVADYDVWRAKYDELLPMREAAGLIDAQVLRSTEDPNMVILVHEFETLEGAKKLLSSPEVKKAMADAGVTAKPVITIGVAID
jgi:quinol monooxygenase YgiN